MPIFVDTNLLVYARDTSEPQKQPRALEWFEHLWQARTGRISFQILEEYYVTVTRKLSPGLSKEEARQDIRDLMAWRPAVVDDRVLEGAWVVEARFPIQFWDAVVVSAAQVLGCQYLLTEDLGHGDSFDGVEVINPFVTLPGSIE